jgi:hypothetical protein
MTLEIYSHSRDGNQTAAIDNMPDFDFEKQLAVKTGTDNFSADAIGQNTPEKNPVTLFYYSKKKFLIS